MHDMTKGAITPHMLRFLAPMVIGNILQQLYNAVASLVVGKYCGENAFAAIGVASPIMNLVIFMVIGMCMGASVLMSEMYGAGKNGMLRLEFSSCLLGGSAAALIFSAAAILCINPLLFLTGTPEVLVPEAWRYLAIIFSGLLFTFLYNILASAFYAIGDSFSPLLFLFLSALLNIALTCLLVIRLDFGVAGAALATVIAQAVSVLLCALYIILRVPLLSLKRSEWKLDLPALLRTARFGIVTATQLSALYIGKLLIQGSVNPLGISAIAAFNAATRIDAFLLAPSESMNNMVATFTAQNAGAGHGGRIKYGLKTGVKIAIIYNLCAASLLLILTKPLSAAFLGSGGSNALSLCISYLRSIALFYIIAGAASCYQGYFRGIGKLRVTLAATATQITLRVVITWFTAAAYGIQSIAFASGIGWIIAQIMLVLIYRTFDRRDRATGFKYTRNKEMEAG